MQFTPCVEAALMTPVARSLRSRSTGLRPPSARPRYTLPILECFEPISLAELDAAALMNRVDAKYVLSLADLPYVLEALTGDYRALEVEGARLCRYATLYFDTPALDLYARHHMGRADRYKVRSRWYLESDAAFFEVKRRNNHGRTIKERIPTEALLTQLTPEASRFVDAIEPDGARPLCSTLWNEFSRLTLVSKRRLERVTFDLHLSYRMRAEYLAGEIVGRSEAGERGIAGRSWSRRCGAGGFAARLVRKYSMGWHAAPRDQHNCFNPAIRGGSYHGGVTIMLTRPPLIVGALLNLPCF
jgi:hypothetical protein